jgi:hypothetical protein
MVLADDEDTRSLTLGTKLTLRGSARPWYPSDQA